jgi:hypothetical protein
MTTHHDRLGIPATATPEQVKAAYHAKLREFPAHTHPDDFKAIRAAYEAIRKGGTATDNEFLKLRPLEVQIDDTLREPLRQKAIAHIQVTVEDLIRETF